MGVIVFVNVCRWHFSAPDKTQKAWVNILFAKKDMTPKNKDTNLVHHISSNDKCLFSCEVYFSNKLVCSPVPWNKLNDVSFFEMLRIHNSLLLMRLCIFVCFAQEVTYSVNKRC